MRFLILSLAVFAVCLELFDSTDAKNLDTKINQSNDKALENNGTETTPNFIKHGKADERNQTLILTENNSRTLSSYVEKSIEKYDENFCTTPECIERAKIIKAKMNESADPCDDFHNYVCGEYVNSTFIPDDKVTVDAFAPLENKVREQLKTIIERPSQSDEPEIFKLAKDLYKLCMDTDAIEDVGEKPIFHIIEQLGGWPVLKKNNEWNETLFNWKKNIVHIFNNTYWSSIFFQLSSNNLLTNRTRREIVLSYFYSSLSRDDLLKGLDNKSVENYFNYMINISVALGAEKNNAKKELKEALEFEIKLINLTRSNEDYYNESISYKPMTLGDLAKKYPYFEWKNYLNHELSYSNITVDDDEIITVSNLDYFDKLEKLLDSTPKKVQANLVIWKEIEGAVSVMNEKIRNVHDNYVHIETGSIKREPRWIECTNIVSYIFSIATSALYVREYFNKESKDNVALMVKNIHNQFIKSINSSSWMDEETKLYAINKAEKIEQVVAYPDELLNNSKINDYYKNYKNLQITNNSYFESRLRLDMLKVRIQWSHLRQEYNPKEWTNLIKSSSVNAIYDSFYNSISVPAGILQGEFFNNELPKYMNYGAIGSKIGHEIMHAFDDEGKQYDAYGNIDDWCSDFTNEQYLKKAQCIINQYGNYTVKEVNMTEKEINTQRENIADNGGIKAVYWAYINWLNENDNNEFEKKLPEFNFTPKQMFWISYANTLCSKSHLENQERQVKHGFQSPSEFRVNGPLSNLEEFSIDFKCPIGSKMNPEKKCTMW